MPLKERLFCLFCFLSLLCYFGFLNSDMVSITTYVDNVSTGCMSFVSFIDFCGKYLADIENGFGSTFTDAIKSILMLIYAPLGIFFALLSCLFDVIFCLFGRVSVGYTSDKLYKIFSYDAFVNSIGSSIKFIGKFNWFGSIFK